MWFGAYPEWFLSSIYYVLFLVFFFFLGIVCYTHSCACVFVPLIPRYLFKFFCFSFFVFVGRLLLWWLCVMVFLFCFVTLCLLSHCRRMLLLSCFSRRCLLWLLYFLVVLVLLSDIFLLFFVFSFCLV